MPLTKWYSRRLEAAENQASYGHVALTAHDGPTNVENFL